MTALGGALTLLCGAAFAATDVAKEESPPPDFSSHEVGWIAQGVNFQLPPSGPHQVTNDPAHAFKPPGRGEAPTFRVADLTNPILTPWARDELKKRNDRILAGGTGYTRQVSCWPMGVPAFLLYGVQPVYFIQSPKEVLMTWQADHQTRHVYLDVPHSANPKPSWYGESVGHYEGDTLVVDTIGLNDKTPIDGYLTPHTQRLHVVERFHLIDGGKTLEVNIHVEDPGAFTMPWNAIQRYRRVEPQRAENPLVAENDSTSSASIAGPMLEASCAENNFSYFANDSIPIPQANKPDF